MSHQTSPKTSSPGLGRPLAAAPHHSPPAPEPSDHAPIGLVRLGADGVILEANQAELALLGYARQDYVGRPFRDFHTDATVADDLLSRLAGGEAVRGLEASLRCKDGSLRHVAMNANPGMRDGRLIDACLVTMDLTTRSTIEHQIRAALDSTQLAARACRELLAHASPEVRALMTDLLVMIELLRDSELPMDQQGQILFIQAASERLRDLIADVFDLFTLMPGQQPDQPTTFDPHALVADLVTHTSRQPNGPFGTVVGLVAPPRPHGPAGRAGSNPADSSQSRGRAHGPDDPASGGHRARHGRAPRLARSQSPPHYQPALRRADGR